MQVRVTPSVPNGTIVAPPSKSLAHRAIICACLAEGRSRLSPVAYSKDMIATIRCMRALGAEITEQPDSLEIKGISGPAAKAPLFLNCGESGSTLRFLIPLASLTGQGVVFTGQGLLLSRPQSVYEEIFAGQRLAFSHQPERIALRGALKPGRYTLRGDVSSQFITGLLFALPLLNGDSELIIEPPFESRSYVELTLQTLAQFGISASFSDETVLRIPGNQRYCPYDAIVEGDYSQAAFFAVLGAIEGRVDCLGLSHSTKQGDAVIVKILRDFGADPVSLPEAMASGMESALPGWSFQRGILSGGTVNLADCPDLGPVLTILGACSQGETILTNAGRLRIKESDRASAMEQELSSLGIDIRQEGDTIRIQGKPRELRQSSSKEITVESHNDHRIAMSLAVFAACGSCPVRINGAECVEKSYPNFWKELQKAGVCVEELSPAHSDGLPSDMAAPAPKAFLDALPGEPSAEKGMAGLRFLIVGLGLIGGSYAMALSRQGYRITAIDVNADSIAYAKEKGFIADGAVSGSDSERFIREADVVVIGLYPTAMVEWVTENQNCLKSGALLTDVSGVKRAVLYQIQESLRPDVELIGSHPMAGREVSGVRNSDDRIFREANFIVTPTQRNTPQAIRFAEGLGKSLGFRRISVLSPEEHDRMIGYLSQLTHAIAVSLMNANDNPHLVEYTGDSFRDLTRIARINETLWSELFALNKDVLIPEIDSFIAALENLKAKLAAGDEEGLKQLFIQSTERRKLFDPPAVPNEGKTDLELRSKPR